MQLYDLSKDPKELNDLAAEYPEIVQRWKFFWNKLTLRLNRKSLEFRFWRNKSKPIKDLGCLFIKICGIDPMGFDLFSSHMAFVKVFYIFT